MLTKTSKILTKSGIPLRLGSIGNGIKLMGDNDYVNVPHHSSFDFGIADDFSVYLLFKMNSLVNASNILIGKRENLGGANYRGWAINAVGNSTSNNFLRFQFADGSLLKEVRSPANSINITDTYGACFVKSGTNASNWKIYINNHENQTMTFNQTLTNIKNTLALTIGQIENAFYLNGNIWNTLVFNKALSQAEASQLTSSYGTILKNLKTNLVLGLPFYEKTGTTAKDISQYNHPATLVGFANTSLGVNNQHIDKSGNGITV